MIPGYRLEKSPVPVVEFNPENKPVEGVPENSPVDYKVGNKFVPVY
jgi:hypothetical protein